MTTEWKVLGVLMGALTSPVLAQEFLITITNPGGVLTADVNPFGPAGTNDSIVVFNSTTSPPLWLRAPKFPSPGDIGGSFFANSGYGWAHALDECETIIVYATDSCNEICLVEVGCECDAPPERFCSIPAATEWTLFMFTLLILVAGTLAIRHQRKPTPAEH